MARFRLSDWLLLAIVDSLLTFLIRGRRRVVEEGGWHRELTVPPIPVPRDVCIGVVPALAFRALRLEGAGLHDWPLYDVVPPTL